jgi:multiple sugar transport system permease protein
MLQLHRNASRRPSRRRSRLRNALAAYGLLAPSLVGILAFLVVPIGVAIWLSFQRWNLISRPRFVGTANWTALATDPALANSALVTVEYVLLVIPLQTALGILLAVLLHRSLPGSGVFRAVLVLPWVCAPLALGIVWRWVFAPTDGALNALLGTSVAWLSEPDLALLAVAVVAVWSQVGYVTLFFLAGLAVIPATVLEAARIDGASTWRIFWHITLPLLRPTLFFVLVTTTISAFQAFDSIYALTQGGPAGATDVIAMHIYTAAFQTFDMGRAAAIAVALFVVLVLISLLQQAYFRRRITYDLS